MTSKVVVDAHAGWPIEVVFEERFHVEGDEYEWKQSGATIVPANTETLFYIHDGKRIVRIAEMKRDS